MTHPKSFREFYPFYLAEHGNRTCRCLHFLGSWLVLVVLGTSAILNDWRILFLAPLAGYGFAWVGHFFFEKNKPASFKYPLYSLMGDWVMFADILRGRVSI